MRTLARLINRFYRLALLLIVILLAGVADCQPPADHLDGRNIANDLRQGIDYQRPEVQDKTFDYVIRAISILVKIALMIMFFNTAWRLRKLEQNQRSEVGGGAGTAAAPQAYSNIVTAFLFIAGALVTMVFSGSLSALTQNVTLGEVLFVGMIVPSFTWIVQLAASGIAMPSEQRRIYWGELSRACLLGSVALLPAAFMNFCWFHVPRWISLMNVLISVAIMAITLYRRTARLGINRGWPISWMLTIVLNMDLFMWISQRWWW